MRWREERERGLANEDAVPGRRPDRGAPLLASKRERCADRHIAQPELFGR